MWCSKILVAYDGSAPSAKAIDLARAIAAQDERVELVLVHVLKLYGMGTGAEAALFDEADRILHDLQRTADEVPNNAHAKLLKGTSPVTHSNAPRMKAVTSLSWAAGDREALKDIWAA